MTSDIMLAVFIVAIIANFWALVRYRQSVREFTNVLKEFDRLVEIEKSANHDITGHVDRLQ
jgi:hypothetical protein